MLKLETGKRESIAHSWIRDSSALALKHAMKQIWHVDWVLLVVVLEDYKSLEVVNERLNRFEKIVVI